MRFWLVTVTILLALASRGHGRPRDPDPLESSQEAVSRNGSPDTRYMTMTRQMTSPTYNRRRDISITSAKYGSNSFKSSWQAPARLSSLNFDNANKNYLPVGALARTTHRSVNNANVTYRAVGKNVDRNRLPVHVSPETSSPKPIPVFMRRDDDLSNATLRGERKPTTPRSSTPIPIPVLIPRDVAIVNTTRGERKMSSRNFVRIVPQKLKTRYNVRNRNSTIVRIRPQIQNVQLKNWPNEALQNVQDLFNYEKYTSFVEDDKDNMELEKSNIPINREPSIKMPIVETPMIWSKVPTIEAIHRPNDRIDVDTSMQIDNLLDDLGKNNVYMQYPAKSNVAQDTVVHILNPGTKKKPNITVTEPISINKINRTRTGITRPPQNVHIMFMMDKDDVPTANQTAVQQLPASEILDTDSDCPTIMINSITQINNTIESKEGCTDLNIVINSHILNTNIFKPTPGNPTTPLNTEALKDPYATATGTPSYNYQNVPSTYYQNNAPSYNYQNNVYRDPAAEGQSNGQPVEPADEISTFEVFQGTHINVGGSSETIDDENPDDATGTDADGTPLSDAEEGANDVTGTNPEGGTSSDEVAPASDSVAQSSNPGLANDVGSGQAIDAPGSISLPNAPNAASVPGQLPTGTGTGGQTSLTPAATGDDDEEDELTEALSPVGLLDSISSVFTYFSALNPINYGIFGMAVAPFVAFAAGIVGVAAFLFPWAFPGNLDFGRSWDDNNRVRLRFNPSLREVVHNSIHKYRHLNEWKGRRRKRKRKR